MAKDEEVAQLNNIISDLERQLFAARMDTDKNAIAELMLVSIDLFSSYLLSVSFEIFKIASIGLPFNISWFLGTLDLKICNAWMI